MTDRMIRIFFVVACGIGIGIEVGHELATWHPLLQWIAPIVGGCFAYLVVDIRNTIAVVPRAWHTVRITWPTKQQWKIARWHIYLGMSSISLMFLLYIPLNMLICTNPRGAILMSVFMAVQTVAPAMLVLLVSPPKHQNTVQELREAVSYTCPPILFCYHVPRGFWWLVRRGLPQLITQHIPTMTCIVNQFIWHWFQFVHSDMRLLCFIDTLLFTSIGLILSGPIFVWMSVGGLFSIFDYRLVSMRWLKLSPRKENTP